MVLKRISPPLCSVFWRETDRLSPSLPRMIHSRPSAQPTISPRCGASARAHWWWRAHYRRDHTVRAPRVCHPPSSPWLENPSPPPPASKAQIPSRSVDPAAPPRLLAPSPPPSPVDPPAPLSLRLRLGRASTHHRLWTPLLWLHLVALFHRLRWAPSSCQLHLGPQSLRLRRGSPDLRLGRQSPWLHTGPPDTRHPPGSLALRLHLGLLLHLFRRRWLATWSRRPFLLHGSSLHRLHRGLSSWLWPGSYLAPPVLAPSCCHPGFSLRRPPPGYPSSSWASSQAPTYASLSCCRRRVDMPSRRGVKCQVWTCLIMCFSSCFALFGLVPVLV